MDLNAITTLSESEVAYTVNFDSIFYGGLSLTREPLRLDLNKHFDVLQFAYRDGSLIIDSENRIVLLSGLLFGASENRQGEWCVNVLYRINNTDIEFLECIPTQEKTYTFFDIVVRASQIFRDQHIAQSRKEQ